MNKDVKNKNKKKKQTLNIYPPFSSMHEVKSLIDLLKGQSVSNKFIHLQFFIHVIFYQFRNALHTLPACRQIWESV